jgi:RNA recognition motif-containing protein
VEIYVGGLDYSVEEEELRKLFEPFGEVSRAVIIREKDSQMPRGFGFVGMPNKEEAEKAIGGLNGQGHRGRTLRVNPSHSPRDL